MKQKITGSVYEKYGRYYLAARYYDITTKKRKTITKATNIEVRYDKKGKEIKKYKELALEELINFKNECLKRRKEINNKNNLHIISNYAEFYLKNKKHEFSESTYYNMLYSFKVKILPYFQGKTFDEVSTIDIKNYHVKILASGLSKNTLKHYHTYIRSLFNEAMLDGLIDKNVVALVKIPKIDIPEKIIFKENDIIKILKNIKGTDMEIPVILGLRYGLRLSEVLGLKWSDIDFIKNKIYIRNTIVKGNSYNEKIEKKDKTFFEKIKLGIIPRNNKTKTKKSTGNFILDNHLKILLKKKLEKIKENEQILGNTYDQSWREYINVTKEGQIYGQLGKHFSKFLKKNEISQGSFKTLRTTFATILFELGIDLLTIKELMRHSNLDTTIKYYIKYTEDKSEETLKILTAYIQNLNIKKEELTISNTATNLKDTI